MASVKTRAVTPKYERKYRVKNWAAYERGLRDRGDVTLWLSEQAIEAWTPPPTGCRGGQPRHSNLAIVTVLALRTVFRLPLRPTEGVIASLLRSMELDLGAKRMLGDHLRARVFEAQERQAAIGCAVSSRMLELGRPESYVIAA